jgi:hypothetical protein
VEISCSLPVEHVSINEYYVFRNGITNVNKLTVGPNRLKSKILENDDDMSTNQNMRETKNYVAYTIEKTVRCNSFMHHMGIELVQSHAIRRKLKFRGTNVIFMRWHCIRRIFQKRQSATFLQ